VILSRTGTAKMVVFGFHPALSPMKYELALPILFANLLRWVSPEIFRKWEISGASVGSVKLAMDPNTPQDSVTVTTAEGTRLPFTVRDRVLNFFSGTPGAVRVVAGDREYVYSLTLPEMGDVKWEPPPEVLKGIPRFAAVAQNAGDLWQWLALAGAAGLGLEWFLYGRFRRPSFVRSLLLRRKSAPVVGVRR
jgi:hypothetical protein